jgi:hypothetical protein
MYMYKAPTLKFYWQIIFQESSNQLFAEVVLESSNQLFTEVVQESSNQLFAEVFLESSNQLFAEVINNLPVKLTIFRVGELHIYVHTVHVINRYCK